MSVKSPPRPNARRRSPASPPGARPQPVEFPALVRYLQESFGGQDALARASGFSVRSISGWIAGQPATEPASRRFAELARLHEGLASIMRPVFVPEWLRTPNAAFDDLKPIEVLERGQVDRIWRMIFFVASGQPT